MTATRSKNLLTLLAAVLLAIAALTFAKLDLWSPVAQVDAAIGDTRADEFKRVYGFRVNISPGPPSDATATWASISGGGFAIETAEVTTGVDVHPDAGGFITIQELLLTGRLNAAGPLTTAATLPETVDPGLAYAAVAGTSKIFTNEFDTDLSQNVTRIEISPLIIPALDSSTAGAQYSSFQPANPETVVVEMDLAVHADDQIVQDWWNATASGASALKDIVVNARAQQTESPEWSTTLFDCTIIDYNPWGTGLGTSGASGAVITQTVSARCDRVEIIHSRSDIQQALADVLQPGAADPYRDIAITMLTQDGADGDVTQYNEAFITRYEFPIFDADEEDVEALDTVVFQANEVVLP